MASLKDRITSLNSTITAAKNVGVTNLNAKGVTASETESVSSLFGKIKNIEAGSNKKITMFSTSISAPCTSRIQVSPPGANTWASIPIPSASSIVYSCPTGVSVRSGLLFVRDRPAMVLHMSNSRYSCSFTSASSSNTSFTTLTQNEAMTLQGNAPFSCRVCVSALNNAGSRFANAYSQHEFVNPVSSVNIHFSNGTVMTDEDCENIQAFNATQNTRISHWVNRLPSYFVSWASSTTVKYHVLGSPITGRNSWNITGFILE